MKRYIIFLMLISCFAICKSQTVVLDSLKSEINITKESNKASLYLKIVKTFFHVNIDSASLYVANVEDYASRYDDKESLSVVMAYKAYISHIKGNGKDVVEMLAESRRMAEEVKSADALLETYNVTGAYFLSVSRFEKALYYFEKNLDLSRKAKNLKYELRSLNNIGAIYLRQSKYVESLRYFIEALDSIEGTSDRRGESVLLINIGSIYLYLDNDDKSIEYCEKGIKIAEKYSYYDLAFMGYHNLGNVFKGQEEYNKAVDAFQKCTSYTEKLSDKSKFAYIYGQLGSLYFKKKNYDLSHVYINKAIEFSKTYNDVRQETVNYSFLVDLLVYEKNYKKAKQILNLSVELSEVNNFLDLKGEAYWDLARINYIIGSYKEAFDFKEKYHEVSDSIDKKGKLDKLEELGTKYETEKTELENNLLKVNSELIKLSLEKRKQATSVLVGLVVLLLVIVLVIFLSYYRRGRLNTELQILNKKQEAYNRTKDLFISILSHDLRTPFNSMIGFSNIINDGLKDDDELSEYSKVLVRTSENTLELLDSVLDWAKSQTGVMDVNYQDTNVTNLVSSVMKTYEGITIEKGITFVNNCDCNCLASVDVDITRTILRNIISNAIKFTNKNGKIEIGCNILDKQLVVFVKDDGIGISKEDQAKLFVIDEKVTKEGTMGEKGSGFGLILIKDLAKLNGGDIWFESELGDGSTFFISFDLV